jgi:DNA polymerase-3 subunit delta'
MGRGYPDIPRTPAVSAITDECHPAVERLWDSVVGQRPSVDALRSAARSPVHAYMLVGPEGSGKMAAAEAFSADLLVRASQVAVAEGRPGAGIDPESVAEMVVGHRHPAVRFVEREGASLSAAQAREVVNAAALAPSVGDLQIFVLVDLHLVSDAAPILLKSIEEPSSHSVFVVLANDVPAELATIASRCVRVDLSSVPVAAVLDALVAEGISPEQASVAARASGGSLRRARLLASDPRLVERRSAWRDAPASLDGTGSGVCSLVDQLMQDLDDVLVPLGEVHEREMADFDQRSEEFGGLGKGERNRLEARHKREARRLRTEEIRSGLAAMLDGYRDRLDDDNGATFIAAAGLVQKLTESLTFNPNETLALRGLFTQLDSLQNPGG